MSMVIATMSASSLFQQNFALRQMASKIFMITSIFVQVQLQHINTLTLPGMENAQVQQPKMDHIMQHVVEVIVGQNLQCAKAQIANIVIRLIM